MTYPKIKSVLTFGEESPIQANLSDGKSESSFEFDTATSHHFCWDKILFSEYKSFENERMSVAIDGVTFPVDEKYKIKLKFGQRLFHFSIFTNWEEIWFQDQNLM